jgi:VCBS repeat-containing protein
VSAAYKELGDPNIQQIAGNIEDTENIILEYLTSPTSLIHENVEVLDEAKSIIDLFSFVASQLGFDQALRNLQTTLNSDSFQYGPLTGSGVQSSAAALAASQSPAIVGNQPFNPPAGPQLPTPPNSAPVVVGSSLALPAGTAFSAITFWPGIDPDGDAVVSYSINDASGSGRFQLGSVLEPEGTSFSVTAAQYATMQYVVGAEGTSDTFTIRASDAHAVGAIHTVTVSGLAQGIVQPPTVLTANNDAATTTSGHPIVINVLQNDDPHLVRITSLSVRIRNSSASSPTPRTRSSSLHHQILSARTTSPIPRRTVTEAPRPRKSL